MTGLLADTTYQAFEEVVKRSPHKTAMIYLGEEYTFSELHEMVLRLAASLFEMGVEKEEKVIVYLYNLPQTIIVLARPPTSRSRPCHGRSCLHCL